MAKILSKVKNIHLVGIGGVGMSGLALLLKDRGFSVTGSDSHQGYQVEMLRSEGIEVFIGHKKEQLSKAVQMLAYSSAIAEDNPEIGEAKERGIEILKRGQLLAELCRESKTIAVAGSHGKTTTTALLGYLLTSLGYEPTVFLGGLPLNYSRTAWWGSQHFLIEADESDGSFLYYDPWVSIITNIDNEHLDHYSNLQEINQSFLDFALKTKDKVFGWGDDQQLAKIINQVGGISFGWGDSNQVQGRNFKFETNRSCFDLFINQNFVSSIKLPLVGEHNCRNALAALAYLWYKDEDLKKAAGALEGFRGTKRRFQIKDQAEGGVTFIDDYAHHPTEIKAVIKAANLLNPRRLLVVFQPHRYSRVKLLFDEFAGCFSGVDRLIVTDIYSAHEAAIEGVDSESLTQAINKDSKLNARYIARNQLIDIARELQEGDLVLSLGAGDINSLIDKVIYEFKKNRARE